MSVDHTMHGNVSYGTHFNEHCSHWSHCILQWVLTTLCMVTSVMILTSMSIVRTDHIVYILQWVLTTPCMVMSIGLCAYCSEYWSQWTSIVVQFSFAISLRHTVDCNEDSSFSRIDHVVYCNGYWPLRLHTTVSINPSHEHDKGFLSKCTILKVGLL